MSHSQAAFMSTTLVPTPLPPNPYDPLAHPTRHAAFDSCLPLERASTWADLGLSESLSPQAQLSSADPSPESESESELEFESVMPQTSPQVAGRTLGYALVHAPSDASRDRVAREITRCGDDPALLAGLAHVFVFGLIRIFMNLSGPAPVEESETQSPRFPSEALLWDDDDDERQPAELELPAGMIPKSLTKKLLPRDRYHCAFTGKVDIGSLERDDVELSASEPAPAHGHGNGNGSYLGVARIASQPLSRPGSEGRGGMREAAQGKLCWASSPAAVLDRLAGIDVEDILPDLDANHPANAFMTDHAPHVVFDRLEMWLTPSVDADGTVLADTYDTHMQRPLLAPFIGVRPRVRFRPHTTPDGAAVPAPSRTLLAIHASCAQIAHLSGAAAVLRDFYQGEDKYYGPASAGALDRQAEDVSTSPNPAAADALMRALRRAQIG